MSRLQTHVAPEVATPAQTRGGFLQMARNVLLLLTLGVLWFVLCRHLSAEWTYNEQYSYGWFVPFFALFLFWLRWEDRPQRSEVGGRRAVAVGAAGIALMILLPLRLFEIANPGWRPLDWLHTGAVAALTLLAIWWVGDKPWLKHFAFPIGFFFVALPWPSPIEEPVVQGLMRGVAALTSESLNLLGIPAQFEGSVIRVNSGLVGVNEACSGVRSLQTSLMIGLLFGELYRLAISRRTWLIIGTVALALVANVMRTFLLVWAAATRGLVAMERGHDIAGYAVLLFVFAGAVGIAAILKKRGSEDRDQKSEDSDQRSEVRSQKSEIGSTTHLHSTAALSYSILIPALAWILFVEIGAEAWYRLHERNLIQQAQWTVRWPESTIGFREIQLDEHTRRMLRFDQGRGVIWRDDPTLQSSPASSSYLLYFFRWQPGHNSALLAGLHRPDVCLPATGWRQTADRGVRYYPVSSGLIVPFRHFEFLHRLVDGREQFAHAFYCLWEDRTRQVGNSTSQDQDMARGPSDWSRAARVRLVLEGRRHLGQQVMEFVMTNPKPLNAADAEARFASVVKELIVAPDETSAEIGDQRSEIGSQRSEVRDQKSKNR
jgi:exosortase